MFIAQISSDFDEISEISRIRRRLECVVARIQNSRYLSSATFHDIVVDNYQLTLILIERLTAQNTIKEASIRVDSYNTFIFLSGIINNPVMCVSVPV